MRTRSMKCAAAFAAFVVVQVGLGSAAWGTTRTTLTEAYVGGSYDSLGGPARELCRTGFLNRTGQNLGMVCFRGLWSGTYKLRVKDVSGLAVGFSYQWVNEGSWYGQPRYGCNATTLTKPERARDLLVFLDGYGGPLNCLGRSPGLATTGEVTLSFSS
jgi:hypothetical protein